MNKKDFCMSWWVTFIAMLIVLISSFALGSDTDSEHYYLSSFIGEFLMIIPIAVGIIPLILRKRTSEISFKVFSRSFFGGCSADTDSLTAVYKSFS